MEIFKVVCLHNYGTDLNINTVYNAKRFSNYTYLIYKNNDVKEVYSRSRFRKLTLKETKEERLKEII